jgi:hypothetical protein
MPLPKKRLNKLIGLFFKLWACPMYGFLTESGRIGNYQLSITNYQLSISKLAITKGQGCRL